jgi:dihydrolipoamide dehydrogenase
MQIRDLPIFIAGDVNGRAPILHEASDDGYIAGKNSVREVTSALSRRVPLAITFTDPNIVKVGQGFEELKDLNFACGEADFDFGRSIISSKSGRIRVYGDRTTKKILGSEMIAPKGEHLGHLLAAMIQQEMTVTEALAIPFYHPTFEETLKEALLDLRRKLR